MRTNRFILSLSFVVVILCFAYSGFSQAFTNDHWSVTYDDCAGTVTVQVNVFRGEQPTGITDYAYDDYMNELNIMYVDNSNNSFEFFDWNLESLGGCFDFGLGTYCIDSERNSNASYPTSLPLSSDVIQPRPTAGQKFKASFSSSVTSYEIVDNSDVASWKDLKVTFWNLPDDLFGNNTKITLKGFWDSRAPVSCGIVNGDGCEDVAFGINNQPVLQKSFVQQAKVPIPNGLGLTASNCQAINVAWQNIAAPGGCPNGWTVEIWRNNVKIGEQRNSPFVDSDANLIIGQNYEYKLRSRWNQNPHRTDYSVFTQPSQLTLLGAGDAGDSPFPSLTASTDDCDVVNLSWTPLTSITNCLPLRAIKIERSLSGTGSWTNLTPTPLPFDFVPPFVDNTAEIDLIYDYRISHSLGGGDIESNTTQTVAPGFRVPTSKLYVKHDALGLNTGADWDNAYTTLGEAMDHAVGCRSIVEIWVAGGTYYPDEGPGRVNDDPNASFTMIKGVKIYGGFPGQSGQENDFGVRDFRANPTILSGDIDKNDIGDYPTNNGNSYHVIFNQNNGVDATSVLDGFTITRGNALPATVLYNGGGIYNEGVSPKILNCIIERNAAGSGAGVANINSPSVVFVNCIFSGNRSPNHAGGLYSEGSSNFITNSVFSGNRSDNWGGAIANLMGSTTTIENSTFAGNFATQSGGAIYNIDNSSIITLRNSIIHGNGSATIGIGEQSIYNISGAVANIRYSLVEYSGGSDNWNAAIGVDQGRNIDADPRFVELPNGVSTLGDLRLSLFSAAIDQGSNTLLPIDIYDIDYDDITIESLPIDIDGLMRSEGGIVDMGAYEYPCDFRNRFNIAPEPYPLSRTVICEGSTALLILQNVAPSQEAVWFTDSLLQNQVYGDNQNRFEPTITHDSIFWGAIRDAGDPNNICPSNPVKVSITSYKCVKELSAHQGDNDAYIDITWNIDIVNPSPPAPDGVFLELLANGIEIYRETKTQTESNLIILFDDGFRHHVGPDQSINYQLNIYKIGLGELLHQQSTNGSTTNQQFPVLTVDQGVHPGRVALSWMNPSKLPVETNVYRDNRLIGTLFNSDSLTKSYSFIDTFTLSEVSLINGAISSYCVEPNYVPLDRRYVRTCQNGNTMDIGLMATDNIYKSKVVLTWNDISAFGDQLQIWSDDDLLETIPNTTTTHTVFSVVPGRKINYRLRLLKSGQVISEDHDTGSVEANGFISGRITTQEGDFAVSGVPVLLEVILIDSLVRDTTYTDFGGNYDFEKVYYGQQSDVKITPKRSEFIYSPLSKDVPMNINSNIKTNIDFTQTEGYIDEGPIGGFQIAISDVRVIPQGPSNAILFELDYTSTGGLDSVYLNVKRGAFLTDVLLRRGATGTFQFIDSTGVPSALYDYDFQIYSYVKLPATAGINVFKDSQVKTVTYPVVFPLSTFAAVPDVTQGYVQLNWTQPATNYEGFKVRRNGKLIATIPAGASGQYIERAGLPGIIYSYSMSAFRTVEGVDYESTLSRVTNILYPALPAPGSFVATSGADQVVLTWTVAPPASTMGGLSVNPLDAEYNFTGFQLYRDDILIGVVYRSFAFEFIDWTGVPQKNYSYKIRAFKETKESISYSPFVMINHVFPAVSPPSLFLATDGTVDYAVQLDWTKPASIKNIQGYILYQGIDSVSSVNSGLSTARIEASHTTPVDYSIASYRVVEGQVYPSESVVDGGLPRIPYTSTLPNIEKFEASNDLTKQIILTWDYPDYVLADFEVYRNNTLIKTIKAPNRKYCDTSIVAGLEYVYQLKAVVLTNSSKMVLDHGISLSGQHIAGHALRIPNNIGIAHVRIVAEANDYYDWTLTDSMGYYTFENVPLNIHGTLTISAEASGIVFTESTKQISASELLLSKVDFHSNYQPPIVDEISPAKVKMLSLDVMPCLSGIKIGWTATNNNYDGFELYRGVKKIAVIAKGSILEFVDTEYVPGILQSYQIRAFIQEENKTSYTDYLSNALLTPHIQSISHLEGVVVDGGNGIDLYWSHQCDSHSSYKIERNGEIVGVIKTGQPMVIRDSTGVPGAFYTYAVTSILNRNGGPYESDPVFLAIKYPVVKRVGNLQVVAPSLSNVDITYTPIETASVYYLNHTQLTWEYTSEYCDTINVYRDEELIASVDCNVRMYNDSLGRPEVQYEYGVGVTLLREGSLVESERQNVSINYPRLARPNSVSGISRVTEGDFRIQFKYPSTNIKEIRVLRGLSIGDLAPIGKLTEIETSNIWNEYIDKSGVPGANYFYAIQAVADRSDIEYSSQQVIIEAASPYPDPAAPKTLVASDFNQSIILNSPEYFATDIMSFNAINVTWDYDIDDDIVGFELERATRNVNIPNTWIKIADLDKGQRKYIDIDNQGYAQSADLGYNYRIRAKRVINTQDYLSAYSNIDGGSVRVETITLGMVGLISNNHPTDFVLDASDGLYTGYTELNWSFTGSADQFIIYRDGQLIKTITNGSSRGYTDGDGIPGKESVYSIRFVGGNYPNYVGADIGYRKGGGSIYGFARTLVGNAPVPNVIVTATGFVDGDYTIVKSTTNTLGEFFLDDLLAIGNQTQYSLRAEYEDHTFLSNPIVRTLPQGQTIPIRDVIFLDKTAYVVSGQVMQPGVTCALEGVTVRSIAIFDDLTRVVTDSETDKNGNYSLVLNPNQEGLKEIHISILPYKIVGEVNAADTIFYDFVPLSDTIFNSSELLTLPISNTINFEERTTYPVELVVQTACNLPVSSAGFSIRVEDIDGCYSKVFKTNAAGKVTANLPPLNYSIRVEDVDNSSSRNLLVLDYFRFKPNTLNLNELAIENGDMGSTVAFQDLIRQEFTYHRPPVIRIVSGFDFLCDDPANPANTVQGSSYSIQFNVSETHEGKTCSISEGYLKITNSASTDGSPRILNFDKDAGRFPTYTYEAGSPSIVSPYLQNMTVEYFSENGSFQGNLSKSVFVTGTAPIPGNDVVVLADTIGGVVQMPMYILRDPPGDGSFSTISAGTTITRTVEEKVANKGQAGLHYEGETNFAAVGIYVNTNVKAGGGESSTNSWQYSVTTNQNISTSSGDTGRDADIIVGMGMAMQYGLQQEISIDPDDCTKIRNTQVQGFGPGEIKTTWFYTYKQIQGFIDEADRIIIAIDAGERELRDASGQVIDPAIAKIRYELYRDSWQKVLEYHSLNTLPWYNLCEQNYKYPANADGIRRKAETDKWRCEFCPKVVDNYNCTDGSFSGLKADIIWDQTLIDIYNKASTSIRNLTADPNAPVDTKWYYDQNKIDITNSYTDAAYNNLYGVGAENITFGSGVGISKSFKSATAGSRSHSNSIYFDGDVAFGLAWDSETNLGFILSTKVVKIQGKFGAIVTYAYEESETHQYAQENTVEIGYTLADNDTEGIGDQYSVTVIQGATHNHTPYFELVGGRTSCPVETGAITRDKVEISLFDIENGVPLASPQSQYNVDPNGAATYYLRLTNLNPFGEEQRDFKVFLDNQSNRNGAFVRLGSALLGNQIFYDVAPGPEGSIVLPLTVQRGFIGYQHEGIRIGIIPYCVDGTTDEFVGDAQFVTINTGFRTPCTSVTILQPDNNWVIKSRNIFSTGREELRIGITDYDPSNANFKNLRFEYRRLGTGEAWSTMLNPQGNTKFIVTREQLADFNAAEFAPGDIPKYFFTWDITNRNLADGQYEIRAVALCEAIQIETYSNVVSGTIDRANIRLFGTPQPSDNIWTAGDEISVRYNKNIDCSIFENQEFIDTSFFLINKSTGNAVPATITCNNNGLIILTDEPMFTYDGDTLQATIANVSDISGNIADSIIWSFVVITHPLYWGDGEITVEMYRGTQLTRNVSLFNTRQNIVNAGISRLGTASNWLGYPNSANVPIIGREIALTFDARNLDVGDYTETLEVLVSGQTRKPQLKINLKVVAEAPDWVVNTADYAADMSVIANHKFKIENTLSTDQLDIISVWINGTLRGVSNIEAVGDFNAAYLAVLGNTEDVGTNLEFRVWDASEGVEYDAFPSDTIFFEINRIEGSTSAPIELIIDKETDQARYIPLNKGWTWFSINVARENKDMDFWLNSLTKATAGDIIKTRDKFAQYTNAGNWIAQGISGLPELVSQEGYMIYLENGPDTLRISGASVDAVNQQLNAGWNWIGYPLQQTQNLNSAISVTNISDGDIIKTTRQNGMSVFATYEDPSWSGSLFDLRPYDAHKILVNEANGGVLFFNQPPVSIQKDKGQLKTNPIIGNPADTMDVSTWIMASQSYEFNTPLIAEIYYAGSLVTDPLDRLAVFVGEDLRAISNVTLVSGVNKKIASLLVKGTTTQESYTLFYYNAAQDKVFRVETELFQNDNGYGTFDDPYIIELGLFGVEMTKKDVNCIADQSGFIDLNLPSAVSPTFSWSHDANATGPRVDGLSAGMYTVTITDDRKIEDIRTFEIINTQSLIAIPTVSGADITICPSTPIILSASSTVSGVSYEWRRSNGLVIGTESSISINDMERSETIKVRALENGVCPSEDLDVPIMVTIDKLENLEDLIISGPQILCPGLKDVNFSVNSPADLTAVDWTITGVDAFMAANATNASLSLGNTFAEAKLMVRVTDICNSLTDTISIIASTPFLCSFSNCPPTINITTGVIESAMAPQVYRAGMSLSSNAQLTGHNYEFTAGETLTLGAGFSVAKGFEFLADIKNCNN